MTDHPFFELESPYRGWYRLHRLSFGSGGPVTTLVAGIHGNECNGTYALNLLAGRLRLQPPRGTVHLVPCVNLFGAEEGRKRWPFDDRDINEVFPGDADGSPVERVAEAVMRASEGQLCVDLQTGSAVVHEVPHVRAPLTGPVLALGQAAGLPVLWRRPAEQFDDGLLGAWRAAGRTALVLRGGRGGSLDVDDAKTMARALVRLLAQAGHLHAPEPAPPTIVTEKMLDYRCEVGGFFVPEVRPGEPVVVGQVLGTLRAAIGGETIESFHATAAGVVLAVRVYPVVHGRELVVRVAQSTT